MTTIEVGQILKAIGRLEGKVDALNGVDSVATKRLDDHSSRLDKLERIAYVALGVAIASGAPQLVAIFR